MGFQPRRPGGARAMYAPPTDANNSARGKWFRSSVNWVGMGISVWVTEGGCIGGGGVLGTSKEFSWKFWRARKSTHPLPNQPRHGSAFDFGKLVKYLILILHD